LRLLSPLENHHAVYTAVAAAILVTFLAIPAGFVGRSTSSSAGTTALAVTPGEIPLHSIEVSRGPDGRFLTPDGMDLKTLAAKLTTLPPEVPGPVVLIKVPASTELQAVPPILKEMETAGIKKIALLME